MDRPLRAKSWKGNDGSPPPSVFLPQHLRDVYKAAQRVLDATAEDQLKALEWSRVDSDLLNRLRRMVLLAAAVHDLGKANDHFQGMIYRDRDIRVNPQGLRHEWVTLLLLQRLQDWLLPAVGGSCIDFAITEWAVAGHHPAFNHPSPPRLNPAGAGPTITILTGHNDFKAALASLKTWFHLDDDPPDLPTETRHLTGKDNVFGAITAWARRSQQTWETLKRTPDSRLVAAVKNTLIAADVAGSALPPMLPNDPNRWDWISQSFTEKPTRDDLQAVIDARSKTFTDKNEDREQFQATVAASTAPVTFVKAGCGTGKTLAAYMWARDQVPGRRLYFCYPTTGTSTEGFRDYLFPPESDPETGQTNPLATRVREIGADLFHSRRKVDFEIILNSGRDSRDADKDAAIKIDSLDAWHTPTVACTVDTALGLVQNNKRGLFAWPALAGAAFVFDEIHAYDDRLFGALLRFLRDLPGLPVLLMTASLPKVREEALQETLKKFRGIDLTMIPGPESLEKLPRYHKLTAGDNELLPEIQKALNNDGKNNGKVLWVCNTVDRVRVAAEFAKAHGLRPLIYHSRFKYEDRVQRHSAVIDAFKSDRAALAICSQVAEMSLDLSADMLVTERATVPAIIQRLGRLNRRAKSKTDPTKPFIVIDPENHLPYTAAELEAARVWLERLPDTDISQRDLAETWEQSAGTPPELVPSAWLDGGPTTTVTELREASPGITVLLEADGIPMLRYEARIRAALRKAEQEKRTVDPSIFAPLPGERHPNDCMKLALPMPPPPRSVDWRAWKKVRGFPIAPLDAIGPNDYDPERGAKWAEQKKK